ncbi:MAG TPA: hypothetical protein VMF55_09230 [Solirubrobacterales bacterium]|nr:hypothetical protein [Solirubrobacterales bacterium]
MSISELEDGFQRQLADFLWDAWAQMGIAATTPHRDPWAVDPEALLLLTFEVGRGEPRLFDEVLDWMLVNERLVSVQRLRNLVVDEDDRALVDAVLGWLGQNRRRPRLGARSEPSDREADPQPFFRDSRLKVADPDRAFLAQGFLKPSGGPSGKSGPPNLDLPINFGFRLRLLLGVGVRSEVARVLLTSDSMSAQALADAAAYTKRNVQEAAESLAAGGFAGSWGNGRYIRFNMPRPRWAGFLQIDPLPKSIDWPRVSSAARRILRWLADRDNQELSEYMLLSSARTMLEAVADDLVLAGAYFKAEEETRDLPTFEKFVGGLCRNLLSVDR